MPSVTAITSTQLSRLIGLPQAPALVDVRLDDDYRADPRPRGADTARPDLTPQSEGLLAASLGYSRMYRDDLPQLEAAMALYDAFYRWCRDASEETHNWPSTKPKA